ncbi:MmcQ/YjbR family DNA-binding protein [Geodermatophilus sp. SYSU D00742]
MATWSDVREAALALPDVEERPGQRTRQWRVRDKGFVWERPLRRADLAALGDAAPDGPVLAAWVPDLGAKEALLADDPAVYFTTPHFDGYPVVLVRLAEIDTGELTELVTEAWLARAPRRLARQYLDLAPPAEG